ncbi:MAG: MFS transporter [Pseudomonadota bacterium]
MANATGDMPLGRGRMIGARIVLLAGMGLIPMGQTVLFALLGPIAREFGLTEVMVGAIISLAAVTAVIAAPWWGQRCDRWGRRPVFLAAMLGLAITTTVFTLVLEAGRAGWIIGVGAFLALAAARIVYGFAVMGAQPAAAGWIADTTTAEKRTAGMALIGAAFGLGAILGPTLAWAMSGFDLLAPLYLIAALALLAAVAAALGLPETMRPATGDRPSLSPADRRLRLTLISTLLAFVVVSSVQQTIAFYIQDIDALDAAATARRVGQAMALLALVMFVTQATLASLKLSPGGLILGGACIGSLGSILLIAWPSETGILLAHAIFGLGFGTLIPGLQGRASLSVSPEEQGATGGMIGAAMAGGYVFGPILGTWLYTQAAIAPYAGGFVLMLIIIALQVSAAARRGRAAAPGSPT